MQGVFKMGLNLADIHAFDLMQELVLKVGSLSTGAEQSVTSLKLRTNLNVSPPRRMSPALGYRKTTLKLWWQTL
jgi:hypothetical protein